MSADKQIEEDGKFYERLFNNLKIDEDSPLKKNMSPLIDKQKKIDALSLLIEEDEKKIKFLNDNNKQRRKEIKRYKKVMFDIMNNKKNELPEKEKSIQTTIPTFSKT